MKRSGSSARLLLFLVTLSCLAHFTIRSIKLDCSVNSLFPSRKQINTPLNRSVNLLTKPVQAKANNNLTSSKNGSYRTFMSRGSITSDQIQPNQQKNNEEQKINSEISSKGNKIKRKSLFLIGLFLSIISYILCKKINTSNLVNLVKSCIMQGDITTITNPISTYWNSMCRKYRLTLCTLYIIVKTLCELGGFWSFLLKVVAAAIFDKKDQLFIALVVDAILSQVTYFVIKHWRDAKVNNVSIAKSEEGFFSGFAMHLAAQAAQWQKLLICIAMFNISILSGFTPVVAAATNTPWWMYCPVAFIHHMIQLKKSSV